MCFVRWSKHCTHSRVCTVLFCCWPRATNECEHASASRTALLVVDLERQIARSAWQLKCDVLSVQHDGSMLCCELHTISKLRTCTQSTHANQRHQKNVQTSDFCTHRSRGTLTLAARSEQTL